MAPESIEEAVEILLVEPNPGDTRLFTEKFREAKLLNTIHATSDGAAALDFLHKRGDFAGAPRPDLVLLDPQLPGSGGEEVLSTLREDPALEDVPVVLLTSSEAEAAIVRASGVEPDTYIEKPVEPEEFVDFVRSVEDFWLAVVDRGGEE